MISAGRVALERALMDHPDIRERVGQPWKVKRLSRQELLKLAAELRIDMRPIEERQREAIAAANRRYGGRKVASEAASSPDPRSHSGAFKGTLEFPLTMDLLGTQVVRRARVTWGHTPDWDYFGRESKRETGDSGGYSLLLEVAAEPETGDWVVSGDGDMRHRPASLRWVPLPLLDHGVLPDALVERVFELIDASVLEQDRDRREMASEMPALRAEVEEARRAMMRPPPG